MILITSARGWYLQQYKQCCCLLSICIGTGIAKAKLTMFIFGVYIINNITVIILY